MVRKSQKEIVLEALKRGEVISSLSAVIDYGIMDLPKRISELRSDGYAIVGEQKTRKNRYGGTTRWKEYRLAE